MLKEMMLDLKQHLWILFCPQEMEFSTLPNSISITDSRLLRMLKGLNKCGRPLGHCTNNKFCFPRKKAHLSVNNHLLKKNTSSSLGNRKMVLSLIESLLSYMSKIIKEHYFFGSYCLGLWIDFETKTEDGEKKRFLFTKGGKWKLTYCSEIQHLCHFGRFLSILMELVPFLHH